MYIVKVANEAGSESCGVAFEYWSNTERYAYKAAENLTHIPGLPKDKQARCLNIYDIGTRPPITRISAEKKVWLDAERMHLVRTVPIYRGESEGAYKHVVISRSRIEPDDMDY